MEAAGRARLPVSVLATAVLLEGFTQIAQRLCRCLLDQCRAYARPPDWLGLNAC